MNNNIDRSNKHTNICFDCQNACGGCSWSAVGDYGKLLFEPVPGWTAEPTSFIVDGRVVNTYHITACPQFKPDPPRERRFADYLALTEEESRWFLERRGGTHL